MSEGKKQPIWTKSFIGITVTQLMLFVVFYALITTLPLYVINHLGGSSADGGLVVTVLLVAAILIRVISAKLLDQTGMKRGLILGVGAFAFTTFFYIWIEDFVLLLILRFIHGLSFGFVTTATGAIVANVVPRERHGEGIGYFGMAPGLAVVIGPFISLTLLQFVSFRLMFVVFSLLTIIAVLFAAFVQLKEEKSARLEQEKVPFSIHDFIEVKALPISFIGAFASFVYASIISFISVYSDSIGLAKTASYFFLVYAVAMLISRPYVGRKFDQLGPSYVVIPGLLLFSIGLVILSFTDSALILLISAAVIGLGYGTITPSFQTMAVQSTTLSRSGHATATFFTFHDFGIAIGSFILGLLVPYIGFQMLYVVCSILLIVVLGLFVYVQSKQKKLEVSK